ncbi:LISK family protein kinase [Cavenderia fasciculata]|uniref:non-specific serine/threonine protein kinase n=1 Tax=Cavenderia fasciculata TaxID=261658 RepID=F4QEE6_CACFS|nr:LISK family protein kinase [Cavenderia fasciculata]EGG13259.1 LISK family protein kinase [Cavenderia fasciculata]|eukprot:XP_004349958.1 LISK family protein kinase [Cavenderia fasciculata]
MNNIIHGSNHSQQTAAAAATDNNSPTTSNITTIEEEEEDDDDETRNLDQDPNSSDIDINALVIGQQIGAGSYGMVYKGSYFKSEVAIKKITSHQREFKKYLKREVSVLKNIQHPNIVQFIGVYYEPTSTTQQCLPIHLQSNSTWIVTQFIGGGTLSQLIKDQSKEFPMSVRFKLALDMALAMAYLHSRDILFRDLKSKNILIDTTSTLIRAKICDFGFARIKINNSMSSSLSTSKNRHLSICGTDEFMAPEVILGMDYDESADIFSFGVVLLEMATRKKISKEIERGPMNAFEIPEDTARDLIPEDIPPLFTELVIDCLRYQPLERPTFSHIIYTLKQLVSLYPLTDNFSMENPLSPKSSPQISRKNSAPQQLQQLQQLQQQQQQQQQQEQEQSPLERSLLLPLIPTLSINDKSLLIDDPNNNNNNNEQYQYDDDNRRIASEEDLDFDDEETAKRFISLKERMLTVLGELDDYIKPLSRDLMSITKEEEITERYDECRKVIEIKKILGEVVEDEVQPPLTPKKTSPSPSSSFNNGQPQNRVSIFLKSMDRSLQEILNGISHLTKKVERDTKFNIVEGVIIARALSKMKKIIHNIDI